VILLLIILASFGIGFTGAAPVKVIRQKGKKKTDHYIELVKKKKTESKVIKEIN
jgi:hypothetical protein